MELELLDVLALRRGQVAACLRDQREIVVGQPDVGAQCQRLPGQAVAASRSPRLKAMAASEFFAGATWSSIWSASRNNCSARSRLPRSSQISPSDTGRMRPSIDRQIMLEPRERRVVVAELPIAAAMLMTARS